MEFESLNELRELHFQRLDWLTKVCVMIFSLCIGLAVQHADHKKETQSLK